MAHDEKITVIAGPTASGKTALAISLAERIGGEIISADSMQFYRGMEIGAATPAADELARAPHHLVSCIAPDEHMASGEFQRRGREIIATLRAAKKPVIVAGGSGLYINALVDGLFEGPPRAPEIRARLRAEAEALGTGALMARLRAVDPEYASILTSENDLIRIVRALEVYEATGTSFSRWHAEHQAGAARLPAAIFGLQWDRAALYARINRRVEQMVAQGWVEEVRALIAAGYGAHIERLKALGYREIAAHLRGEQTLGEAIAKTQMHHRRYAKRQLTWFRNDPRVQWLPVCDAPDETARLADEILRRTGRD